MEGAVVADGEIGREIFERDGAHKINALRCWTAADRRSYRPGSRGEFILVVVDAADQNEAAAERRDAERMEVGENADGLVVALDIVADIAEIGRIDAEGGHVEIGQIAVQPERQEGIDFRGHVHAEAERADAGADGEVGARRRRSGDQPGTDDER